MKKWICGLMLAGIVMLPVGCSTLGKEAGNVIHKAGKATQELPPPGAIDPETGQPYPQSPPNTPLGWLEWGAGIVSILAGGYVVQKGAKTLREKSKEKEKFLGEMSPDEFKKLKKT